MESGDRDGVVVPPGEGPKVWVIDELMTFVATGDTTGGAYALTDSLVPPGGGPPPHIHHREDEAFWVLEGELEVVVGDRTFRADAGSYVHLPRGVPHAFRNVGAGTARFLTLLVPSGLELFFEEVGTPGSDPASPPPITDGDIDRLLAAAPEYGLEILPAEGQGG